MGIILIEKYSQEIEIKEILDCFPTIIADKQKIGNMVPAGFDQITGAPSDSLVNHLGLHMQ